MFVKVTDVGLALKTDEFGHAGTAVGWREYASVESLTLEAFIHFPVD